MLTWWLVQIVAGAVMVALFRYQRWTVSRWRGRVRLDEGFGTRVTPSHIKSCRRIK
jgi:hypothetical protein